MDEMPGMKPYKPNPQRSRLTTGATDPEQLERMRSRRAGTMDDYLAGKARKPPLFQPYDPTEPYDEMDSRHGTHSAYTAGCRCTWCRLAGVQWRRYKKAGVPWPKGFNVRDDT